MLEEKELLGIEDFELMQSDFTSKTAKKYVPEFLTALKTERNWNDLQAAAIQKLTTWNFKLSKESQAASIFEILYRKVMENLVKDELSAENFNAIKGERVLLENLLINVIEEKNSSWIDDITTTEKETFADIVVRSFKETVEDLQAELGRDSENWNWGKIHKFTISHPLGVVKALDKALNLNRGPFEMPGSYHTVCPYSYSFNNLYMVNHGASHRHIFDTNNWDQSETIIPTGTSGIPASNYYLDQTKLYIENNYHADPFSFGEVQKAAKFKMKFVPK